MDQDFSRIFIGVDPDTTTTGIAIRHPFGRFELHLARSSGRFAEDRMLGMSRELERILGALGAEAAAVEWQSLRPRGEKNPNAIMMLQAVAGMATSIIHRSVPTVYRPIPADWRGSAPKEAVQKRILELAGLTIDSEEFVHIPMSMRTHVIDALGLAIWASQGGKKGRFPWSR